MKEVEFVKANTIGVTMMLADDEENETPSHIKFQLSKRSQFQSTIHCSDDTLYIVGLKVDWKVDF